MPKPGDIYVYLDGVRDTIIILLGEKRAGVWEYRFLHENWDVDEGSFRSALPEDALTDSKLWKLVTNCFYDIDWHKIARETI